jgi:hypothetical protein
MADPPDDAFYARADAHIHLSNDQTAHATNGKVSASMMYATARFNTWLTALGHESGESLAASREETIAYFLDSYRSMLDEHFDEYIANFADYMRSRRE